MTAYPPSLPTTWPRTRVLAADGPIWQREILWLSHFSFLMDADNFGGELRVDYLPSIGGFAVTLTSTIKRVDPTDIAWDCRVTTKLEISGEFDSWFNPPNHYLKMSREERLDADVDPEDFHPQSWHVSSEQVLPADTLVYAQPSCWEPLATRLLQHIEQERFQALA